MLQTHTSDGRFSVGCQTRIPIGAYLLLLNIYPRICKRALPNQSPNELLSLAVCEFDDKSKS